MTAPALAQPTITARLGQLWKALQPRRAGAAPAEDRQEDARAERDFILDMLDSHPDAFQSEMDMVHMSRRRRGKY